VDVVFDCRIACIAAIPVESVSHFYGSPFREGARPFLRLPDNVGYVAVQLSYSLSEDMYPILFDTWLISIPDDHS
jgi:hypothetical protein